MSKKVDVLPILIAAPFWSFIAPRYPKYNHCTASLAVCAGTEISNPYFLAISFNAFNALICSDISSRSLIVSSRKSSQSKISKSFSFSSISLSTPYNATRL